MWAGYEIPIFWAESKIVHPLSPVHVFRFSTHEAGGDLRAVWDETSAMDNTGLLSNRGVGYADGK